MKKYVTAGLLVWIPLAVTVWILETIVRASDKLVAALPVAWQPSNLIGFDIPGLGLLIAFFTIFVTGLLAANFIGQKLVQLWEALLTRIPIVRPIYSGIKQIADTLLSQKARSFKEVVLIEFPQRGQWTYGFIVSEPDLATKNMLGNNKNTHWVTVYIPTAPNPTSGYVVMADAKELRHSDVSVDDAFKFHVSLGVLSPVKNEKNREKTDTAKPEALN